ncbi:MAG: hypothetical protein H6752_16680 [Candidatus Omnitrophica bacterium]|nr:hypothetical protein [Candidatus Omnitrophota bacterium]
MKKKAIFLALTLLLIVAGFFVFHDDGRPDDLPRRYRIEALWIDEGKVPFSPTRINNSGAIIGMSEKSAYLRKPSGDWISLGSVMPVGLNDQGQIDAVHNDPNNPTGNYAVRFQTSNGLVLEATQTNFSPVATSEDGDAVGRPNSLIGCSIWDATGDLIDLTASVEPKFTLSAINADGTAVGTSHHAPPRMVLWSNGKAVKEVEIHTHLSPIVTGINSNGRVVGGWLEKGSIIPFIWSREDGFHQPTDQTHLVSKSYFPTSINDRDQIVGYVPGEPYLNSIGDWIFMKLRDKGNFNLVRSLGSRWPTRYSTALLWERGQYYNLDWFISDNSNFDRIIVATDINNRGQIIGVGEIDGEKVGFLMTPEEDSRED